MQETAATPDELNLAAGEVFVQGRAHELFKRLRTDRIDLMQIHNLIGVEQRLPVLREWKQAGRFRYIGATTSFARQYDAFEKLMRNQQLDFVQVDYSIDDRAIEQRILPLAAERGMAVLVNSPFRRGRTRLPSRCAP